MCSREPFAIRTWLTHFSPLFFCTVPHHTHAPLLSIAVYLTLSISLARTSQAPTLEAAGFTDNLEVFVWNGETVGCAVPYSEPTVEMLVLQVTSTTKEGEDGASAPADIHCTDARCSSAPPAGPSCAPLSSLDPTVACLPSGPKASQDVTPHPSSIASTPGNNSPMLLAVLRSEPLGSVRQRIGERLGLLPAQVDLVRVDKNAWLPNAFTVSRDRKTLAELGIGSGAHFIAIRRDPPAAVGLTGEQPASQGALMTLPLSPDVPPLSASVTEASNGYGATNTQSAPATDMKTVRALAKRILDSVSLSLEYREGEKMESPVTLTFDSSKTIGQLREAVCDAIGMQASSSRLKVYRQGEARLLANEQLSLRQHQLEGGVVLGVETGLRPGPEDLFLFFRPVGVESESWQKPKK